MAHRQSYGYSDEPKWKWRGKRDFYKNVHSRPANPSSSAAVLPVAVADVPDWYDSNIRVDFLCAHETQIDEHVWVCNPGRLNHLRSCIVYTSGPSRTLDHKLRQALPSCEIHSFDPSITTKEEDDGDDSKNTTTADGSNTTNAAVTLHGWGFAETTHGAEGGRFFRSISDTMQLLGHRSIDLMVLQCGGCEWNLDYFSGQIHQLSIQFNDVQRAAIFEQFTSNYYVLFRKDPLSRSGTMGRRQALSYLKLKKGFFA